MSFGFIDTFKQVLDRREKRLKNTVSDRASVDSHESHQLDTHDPIDLDGWQSDEEDILNLRSAEGCAERVDAGLQLDENMQQREGDNAASSKIEAQKIGELVVLTVMAQDHDHFEGSDLLREFYAEGLKYGKDGLFHAYHEETASKPLYSVCNVLSPGVFEEQKMIQLRTKGVALFFEIPCEHSGKMALNTMMGSAHQIAVGLGGNVMDGERRPLTACTLQRLHDRLHECEYRKELELKKSSRQL
ncbi:MAG: hypothetical protein HN455_10335 [Gammaproteobacteria bacterium]|jgi:cell division protein ZipA|nr:hypothetical protein [Gammaproteobacteria bacterium]HIJ22554.1 hypothetical protein [Gammaproteobacteria bacterium]HIJ24592.1 hypothetical protein [Gammaproteobacteria bacterium]